VNDAPELIKVLPWGPGQCVPGRFFTNAPEFPAEDFEVDVFRKPDFTALEVVSFATGGERIINMLSQFSDRVCAGQVYPLGLT
jgi:hypothetical protein